MADFAYQAYGLQIRAATAFPELPPGAGVADVCIRHAPLARLPSEAFEDGRRFASSDGVARLDWQGRVAIEVRDGREIVVDRQDAGAAWVRQCVLGPALGVLLHQRGLLVLHASAVAVGGLALVLLGHKGRGKSTTAAALHLSGHPLLADDLVVVDESGGRPVVRPGFAQMKLRTDAAAALGVPPDALTPFHPRIEKGVWMAALAPEPVPLGLLCALEWGGAPALTPLEGSAAFVALFPHAYALRFLGRAGATAALFHGCARLAATVPLVRLTRPCALEGLAASLALLETACQAGGPVPAGVPT